MRIKESTQPEVVNVNECVNMYMKQNLRELKEK